MIGAINQTENGWLKVLETNYFPSNNIIHNSSSMSSDSLAGQVGIDFSVILMRDDLFPPPNYLQSFYILKRLGNHFAPNFIDYDVGFHLNYSFDSEGSLIATVTGFGIVRLFFLNLLKSILIFARTHSPLCSTARNRAQQSCIGSAGEVSHRDEYVWR